MKYIKNNRGLRRVKIPLSKYPPILSFVKKTSAQYFSQTHALFSVSPTRKGNPTAVPVFKRILESEGEKKSIWWNKKSDNWRSLIASSIPSGGKNSSWGEVMVRWWIVFTPAVMPTKRGEFVCFSRLLFSFLFFSKLRGFFFYSCRKCFRNGSIISTMFIFLLSLGT